MKLVGNVLLMRWNGQEFVLPLSKNSFLKVRNLDNSGNLMLEVIDAKGKSHFPYQKDLAIIREITKKEATEFMSH